MKIMALSDQESPLLWDHFDRRRLEGIDLILSCGDLDPRYLSFLTTFTIAPVVYVHGNHDDRYAAVPPEGCVCAEDRIVCCQGVRVFGLGGSMRYKRQGEHQYTQRQMDLRVRRRRLSLIRKGGFDILLTHAPALGLNDGEDLAHMGFDAFNGLMDRYRPRYFIHGHVHMNYGSKHPRLSSYGDTQVINAFETYTFDY
ncbi:MAG: metallophosphoesterase [Lawsonibacter sp.]|jgi:Icc-related predicted phosphoesterase|nr:metallophosphoesterase [Lawsonibacter sp.]